MHVISNVSLGSPPDTAAGRRPARPGILRRHAPIDAAHSEGSFTFYELLSLVGAGNYSGNEPPAEESPASPGAKQESSRDGMIQKTRTRQHETPLQLAGEAQADMAQAARTAAECLSEALAIQLKTSGNRALRQILPVRHQGMPLALPDLDVLA
jgi:hypothetical protein